MEYREVCRRDGTPTGEIVEKHAPKRSGDYFRHALAVLKAQESPAPGQGEGLYIAQQRSLLARFYAGKWDVTGGGVRAGETPRQAAAREIREELCLTVPTESLTHVYDYTVDWADGTGLIISMFACRAAVPDGGFQWDKTEVNDVRLLPFRVFRAHVMDHNGEDFGRALDWIEASI